jgi:hypothetical protein
MKRSRRAFAQRRSTDADSTELEGKIMPPPGAGRRRSSSFVTPEAADPWRDLTLLVLLSPLIQIDTRLDTIEQSKLSNYEL